MGGTDMRTTRTIQTVESHTMGEPTRIVIGGLPKIPGKTMPDKMKYLQKNMDYLRTMLMLEPRGHNDMSGAIYTDPVNDEADIGVIFMDGGGYLNMCGHGSIGAATCAVEMGIVPVTEPYTNVVLETPAGLIRARTLALINPAGVSKTTFVYGSVTGTIPISTAQVAAPMEPVSYTHLRAHETRHDIVCRLLLEKKKTKKWRSGPKWGASSSVGSSRYRRHSS